MHRISIDGMSLINSTKSSAKLNWNYYMILFVTFFSSQVQCCLTITFDFSKWEVSFSHYDCINFQISQDRNHSLDPSFLVNFNYLRWRGNFKN